MKKKKEGLCNFHEITFAFGMGFPGLQKWLQESRCSFSPLSFVSSSLAYVVFPGGVSSAPEMIVCAA